MTQSSSAWNRLALNTSLLARRVMWSLRLMALRAAGVAALALGVQAWRWMVKRGQDEGNKSQELELSPFASPATESVKASSSASAAEVSPLNRKDGVPSSEGTQPRILSFGLSHNEGSDKEGSDSDEEGSVYHGSSAEASDTDSNSRFDGGGASTSAPWDPAADAAAHVHTPDVERRSGLRLAGPQFSFPRIDYVPEMKSPYDLEPSRIRVGNGPASMHEQRSPSNQGRHSRKPSFPTADFEPDTPTQGLSDEMTPAPTEEGDAIGSNVDEVLADMDHQTDLGTRRYSRSFSEPNLLRAQMRALEDMPPEELDRTLSSSGSSDNDDYYGTIEAQQSRDLRAVLHAHNEAVQTHGNDPDLESPRCLDPMANGISQQQAADSLKRSRTDAEVPPLLRLDILSGPAKGRTLTVEHAMAEVTIGRLEDNALFIDDNEVSGHHAQLRWEPLERCWQVRDVGSLNGTRLNGNYISNTIRRAGRQWRLNSDDILQLGSHSTIKVVYLPNASQADLPVHPKRVYAPPTTLQTSPTLKSETMTRLATASELGEAVVVESLRLDGALVCRTGREHQRRNQRCEDVPYWSMLPGAIQAGFFCVFDGHCGRSAAEEVTSLLPDELSKRLDGLTADLASGQGAGAAWEETFLAADDAIQSEDGCTATAVLVWKDHSGNLCIQAANVGDSAAIFAMDSKRASVAQLTADHRISNPDERARLANMGIALGDNRTRLYGLNVSRCLGDKFIKDEDLGFSAVPYVSPVVKLGPEESGLLIIASDGLWDVAESERVMEVAFEARDRIGSNPMSVAEAVAQHAQRQRTKDDVTVILLEIRAEASPM